MDDVDQLLAAIRDRRLRRLNMSQAPIRAQETDTRTECDAILNEIRIRRAAVQTGDPTPKKKQSIWRAIWLMLKDGL